MVAGSTDNVISGLNCSSYRPKSTLTVMDDRKNAYNFGTEHVVQKCVSNANIGNRDRTIEGWPYFRSNTIPRGRNRQSAINDHWKKCVLLKNGTRYTQNKYWRVIGKRGREMDRRRDFGSVTSFKASNYVTHVNSGFKIAKIWETYRDRGKKSTDHLLKVEVWLSNGNFPPLGGASLSISVRLLLKNANII